MRNICGMFGCIKRCTTTSWTPDKIPDSGKQSVSSVIDDSKTEVRKGIISPAVDWDDKKEVAKHAKTQTDAFLVKNAIAANDFLSNVIDDSEVEEVVEAMYLKELAAGDTIIKQGDEGDFFCVSASGCFEVIADDVVINSFENHLVFGEHALLYNAPRNATVRCRTDCQVWMLDREDYQRIIIRSALKEQNEYFFFLKNVPILNQASNEKLRRVAYLLKREFFNTNVEVVREGEPGDKIYIIRAGSVTVAKDGEGVVATMVKGQFFGERALLAEDRRQATCTADPPGLECLSLDRRAFIDHFGDLGDFVHENNVGKQQQQEQHVESKEKVTRGGEHGRLIELGDLKIVATLGVGGYGRVELVQHKKKGGGLVFALKYLKKVDMLQQNQQGHAFNEKTIQMGCKCLFIVRMYKTFHDNKYLYFLMESCLGGDLFALLQRQKNRCFPESHARFLAACVLEALTYLHGQKYIYRDLKPENLMVDARGYIKLTDFGFAKHLPDDKKTYTFAGTPEYVAPEIVLQRGHDKAVDYWAFGVFVFEMLVGRTPFRGNDTSPTHMKTYNLIMGGIDSVRFPDKFPRSAQDLVKKLCRPSVVERLGCQRKGAQAIHEHKWFLGFDWAQLRVQKMKAPWVPKLKDDTDTRYFETFRKDTDVPPDDLTTSFEHF